MALLQTDLMHTTAAVPAANDADVSPIPVFTGRGMKRRHLTAEECLQFIADLRTGKLGVTKLTLRQAVALAAELSPEINLSAIFQATRGQLRKCNGHNGNGGNVDIIVDDETAVETTVPTTMGTIVPAATMETDTPEARIVVRRFAASLGYTVAQIEDPQPGSYGPYVLRDAAGRDMWLYGMPLTGIADALLCLERERELPLDRYAEAWKDFGKTWKR
jgi:hypothetical protein